MPPKLSNKDALKMLQKQIEDGLRQQERPDFIPSGIQEDIIIPFGCGDYKIVVALDCNKAGKTATAVQCLANVFWDNDKDYFNYNVFNEWPYPKKGRITGTVKNTADDGPIREEIKKWWAPGRYEEAKGGKNYYSSYKTDTGFSFDILTYKQEPDEFEGPMLGWTWSDEPPKDVFVGPITSRFAEGGIWLITATPIKCGPFLAVLDDLQEKETPLITVTADIRKNDTETGKPNHLGTKKGLWTTKQIDDYSKTIPLDEQDARLHGKANSKSGTVYYMFDRSVHVSPYDIGEDYAKEWNCFHVMDPHAKHFPAMQWWAMDPKGDFICYNEWPTYDFLAAHYDEVRNSEICNYTIEELSRIIKVLDGSNYGLEIKSRWLDPRSPEVDKLILEYAKHGIDFHIPPAQSIETQRERIRELLSYDKQRVVSVFNKPKIYICPHCVNTTRSFERHYWDEEKDKESERYKDFMDAARYFFAGLGNAVYEPKRVKKKVTTVTTIEEHYEINDNMYDVCLG